MAKRLKVKESETIPSLAYKCGFKDWNGILDENDNQSLSKLRPNPDILKAGDVVYIPDKKIKQESADTEKRNRFRRTAKSEWLRIYLKDIDDEPLANKKYSLIVGKNNIKDKTNKDGLLEQKISPNLQSATLSFDDWIFHLIIGGLDPIESDTGWQARLINLGYAPDLANSFKNEVISPENTQLKMAIEGFQLDNNLKVDGIVGPKTQAKLKDIYGC